MGQRPIESNGLYMIKKICVGYQQEGIDPPLGEKSFKYDQT